MKYIIKTALLIVGFSVAGCASPVSEQAILVKDSDESTVKDCKYLGDVHGSSTIGGMFLSTGIGNAKNEARGMAAKINATHVVWGNVGSGTYPSVSAKAYNCKNKQ